MRNAILAFLMAMALTAPAALAADSSSQSSSSSSSTHDNDRRSNSSSSRNSSSRNDQDDARDALRRGKVMPLTAILEIAFRRERGTVLEVELETEDRVLTYKIDMLSEAGRKVRMRLNARTGEVLTIDYR